MYLNNNINEFWQTQFKYQRSRRCSYNWESSVLVLFKKLHTTGKSFEYLFTDNSIETIVQGRTPTYGDEISFQVPRRGDMLSKIYLKIVLPPTYLYSNLLRSKTDSLIIYSIIEHVELL